MSQTKPLQDSTYFYTGAISPEGITISDNNQICSGQPQVTKVGCDLSCLKSNKVYWYTAYFETIQGCLTV